MTKKEFETTDEPLCMIVSLAPCTGQFHYDTFEWQYQSVKLREFEKDFPHMMHFTKLNPAGIQARKQYFGAE